MTKQTLYSLRTDGPDFRITKIVDGEIESSYICTVTECECPAGHRPSCRHRQMLPDLIARDIVNTHWFWDFDLHRVVDFNGELKSNLDALNELANIPGVTMLNLNDPAGMHNAIAEAVGEAPLSEPTHEVEPQRGQWAGKRLPFDHGRHEGRLPSPTEAAGPLSEVSAKPWRRL